MMARTPKLLMHYNIKVSPNTKSRCWLRCSWASIFVYI